MSRVRFECAPCATINVVSVLDVELSEVCSVRVLCPSCSALVVTWLGLSDWWVLACLRASVRDELDLFAAEVARVRTPADIGGVL